MSDLEPVTTWAEAARILKVGVNTLTRVRKELGDQTIRPWWRNPEAVVAWYEALIAPKADQPAPSRRRAPKPFDAESLRSELLEQK